MSPGEADFEREFSLIPRWERLEPSFNVAPTQVVPIIRLADGGREREAAKLRWGLVPFFARGIPPKYSTINARVETLETAASYRGPWKRSQRCLQVASGFYEWHLDDRGTKIPFYIRLVDRQTFAFAALWDRSVRADGTVLESCAHITLPANDLMRDIHNAGSHPHRMPAILCAADYDAWIGGGIEAARAVLRPYPADLMLAYAVSTRVNSPRNNDPDLITPREPASPEGAH